ncbi:MAG: hypothetical protein AB1722_05970 [Pseudomonadota bacterium]
MNTIELHMADSAFSFRVLSGTRTGQRIPVRSLAGVHSLLAQGPLTAATVEAGIAAIEDLLMPALRALPDGADLVVAEAAWSDILRGLAGAGEPVPVAAIETQFNHLADVASGSPARLQPVSTAPLSVLKLLLLREVMHHGGFATVAIRAD